MKRFFKIALIVLMALGATALILIAALFIKLPSASSIGQKFTLQKEKKSEGISQQQALVSSDTSVSSDQNTALDDAANPAMVAEIEAKKKQALLDDFISKDRPLSDFCLSLKNSNMKIFSNDEQVNQALEESVFSEKKDPRIQAMKPTLRYVMQLPKMSELLHEVKSANSQDETLVQKAEFYKKAYDAFSEVQDHRADLESIMDRSYLFLGLNNLVAAKPELLNDSRLQNYCVGVETAFNQNRPVAFVEEKTEFLNFLNDLDVNPADIQFDPQYKTQIDFELTPSNIGLKGQSWLGQIFRPADVEPDPVAR